MRLLGLGCLAVELLVSAADCRDLRDTVRQLCMAEREGNLARVHALIEHDANIKAKCVEGVTALHEAVSWGHKDGVGFLITRGADMDAKSDFGDMPLYVTVGEDEAGAAHRA